MGERCCPELPEECWTLIMKRVDHESRFESLSLVSKQFLSITNRLRSRFTLTNPSLLIRGGTLLPSLINNRFHHLKTIDFSLFHGDLEPLLLDFAAISFNTVDSLDLSNHKRVPVKMLSNFGKLRALKCANVCRLSDADLVDLVTVFPLLEELDISYPNSNAKVGEFTAVTDVGMEALWSGLRNLRVLNMSGNHFVTDTSLVGLALNCLSLTQFCVVDCSFITYTGLQFMMCSCRDLSVLQVNGVNVPSYYVGPSSFGKALSAIDFSDSVISDEFLHSIAQAGVPLKRFGLCRCTNFTFFGVSMLLCTYRSLEYLAFVQVDVLTDQCIHKLTPSLGRLVSVKLDACSKLTNFAFLTLVNNCRSLESVEISRTCMGDEYCFMEFVGSPRIKSLNLARNLHLTDGYLKFIASAFPNLELLDLSGNSGITDEGIAYVLKTCGDIRNLQISDCRGIKSIGPGAKLPKLEVLRVTRSGIKDKGLVTIWSRCSGLLKLDLEGCGVATTKRVQEVVQNCERLREINLKGCCNVDVFSVATRLMISKPSLMKIITPRNFSITNNLQKHLLSHGCLLSAD